MLRRCSEDTECDDIVQSSDYQNLASCLGCIPQDLSRLTLFSANEKCVDSFFRTKITVPEKKYQSSPHGGGEFPSILSWKHKNSTCSKDTSLPSSFTAFKVGKNTNGRQEISGYYRYPNYNFALH